MHCPFCNSAEIQVKDSRALNETIRRRRVCKQCDSKFTTLEFAQLTDQILIHGSSDFKYSHKRLLRSLLYASSGQFTPYNIERYIIEIEKMLSISPSVEIKLEEFVRKAVKVINKYEPVLAVRFLSLSSLSVEAMREIFRVYLSNSSSQNVPTPSITNQLELSLAVTQPEQN